MTGRFDPRPGEPYARCQHDGCGFTADTKEQIAEHSRATMAPTGEPGVIARGHSYRVENPSRAEALEQAVQREADDAMESAATEFVDGVYRLHTREGVPLKELTEAVKHTEFAQAWADYIADEVGEEFPDEDADAEQLHQADALLDLEEVQP